MRSVIATILFLLISCSTFSGLKSLREMSPAELDRYSARVSLQVEAVTSAVLAEGDLTRESAISIAAALDGMAAGTVAPGVGALGIDLEGYGALALAFIISEIDAQLDERGAFDSGGWLRAAPVLRAMSSGIVRAVASQEP